MKQFFRVDENGFYVAPVIAEEKPDDCVEETPPNGLYKPRWNGEAWVEGASEAEIQEIKNRSFPPSEEDELRKRVELMQRVLDDLLLGGGL